MEKGGAVTSGLSSQYALKTRAAGQPLSVPPLCFSAVEVLLVRRLVLQPRANG